MSLAARIAHFGTAKGTLIFTFFCVLFSPVVYLIIAFYFSQIRPVELFVSLLTPALVAPPVCIILLRLTRSLNLAQEDLLKFQEELEKKVADRTQELSSTNDRLENEIQEKSLIEQELHESRRKLADITEFLPDATLAIDQEGKVIAWNRAIETMTGVKKDDVLGKGNYEYAIPFYGTRRPILIDFVSLWDKDIEKQYSFIKKEGDTLFTETNVPFVRGQNRILWAKASPLFDTQGNVIGAIESIRDITERKEAEDAIRKSGDRYRTIFENTGTSNIIISEDLTIIMANNNFVSLSGYTKQEVEGKIKWTEFVHKDDLEKMKNFHRTRRVDPNSAPSSYEFRAINRKGEVLNILLSITLIPETKESVVSLIDITERKQLEAQLTQARKMEAIGTLSGGIAHDFNNILMSIQGYVSLILLETANNHPHYEWLKLIEEQAINAAGLTRQLLGFARGGKYEVKPVNMNDLIEKTSTMFGRTKKEIAIHRKYEKDTWIVEADLNQIEQVFLNLYLNAWQAMPAGGDLSLETRNIVADEAYAKTYSMAPGRYVRISVSDTGLGMDEKTKERIFEPFFTTKDFGRGNGLGLAMVYGIIKSHNGFIDVISEPGKGTTFMIHFPASDKNVVKEKHAVLNITKGTETILVVDDEPNVLRVSKTILESLGYKVYGAKNGEEAIALYRDKQNEVDLIVLDMIMPGLSGDETFDHIRKLNPAAKIILSSGYSLKGQAQQIMNKGCRGFVQKPFSVAGISGKIREVLDQ